MLNRWNFLKTGFYEGIKVEFAPYNQVFQQLLDPSSLLSTNKSGLNAVLLRLEDLGKFSNGAGSRSEKNPPAHIDENIERNVRDLVSAIGTAVEQSAAPILVCACPASPSVFADPGRMGFFQRMEELMSSGLSGIRGVYAATSADLAASYPVTEDHDPYRDRIAHVPYTPAFYTALGTLISRKAYAIWSAPHKVIALDCDQTLWKGICGEDGALGIAVDPPWRALQEFIVGQHEAGMLICLCSKNNEKDVLGVFEHRADMPLKRDHVVSWRVNWSPKSENLESLAQELNLSLDSFVFIDDDPVECAEVRANCPEVLTLNLPQDDPDSIPAFLNNVWAFDRIDVTAEDRNRTALYRQNREREDFRSDSLNFAEFLTNLDLRVRVSDVVPDQLARVAQLTKRTNQFNLTTVRRSEEQIQELLRSLTLECLVVEVSDRFGDYGLVGAIMLQPSRDSLDVDTFLLSCRAMGRGVEHRMLARLGEIAESRGLSYVNLAYERTGENRPALDFLDDVGARFKRKTGQSFSYRLPARAAVAVHHRPTSQEPAGKSDPRASDAGDAPFSRGANPRSELFERIALELNSAEHISKAIESWMRRPRSKRETALVPPRTPIEEALAAIWSEVLGVEEVGKSDNFFQLGGDSLSATGVMSRVLATFGVELPFERFFDTPTLADASLAIAEAQIQEHDETEIAAFLNELDQPARKEKETKPAGRLSFHARSVSLGPDLGLNNGSLETGHSSNSIASVGVITRDRLDACERALNSYIENVKGHGRTPEFVVMDDSGTAKTRDSYRQMLRQLSVHYGVTILYGGLEEKTTFVRKLIETGSLPPEVVSFALFGVERSGNTFGANQNALQLHTVGNTVFTVDDDTVCKLDSLVTRGFRIGTGE